MDWKPFYDNHKAEIIEQREQVSRRQAAWANSSPRGLAELHDVLKSIPSGLPYDEWFPALAAIYHETRGSDEGLALAHEWSAHGYDAYDAAEVDTIWDGFNPDHPYPATMGRLIALARKYDTRFVPLGGTCFATKINRNLR